MLETMEREVLEGLSAGRRRARATLAAAVAATLTLVAGTVAASCGAASPGPPAAMTIHVAVDGSGDYPTLADAVREAPVGATVVLGPGRYELDRPLDIFRPLNIAGAGADRTEVTCRADGRVLGFSGNGALALRRLTLSHVADATDARPADVVIALGGDLDLDDCRITGGLAISGRPTDGSGLYLLGDAQAKLTGCEVSGNRGAAVVLEDRANVVLRATRLRDNGRDRPLRVVHAGSVDRNEFDHFLEPIVLRLMTDRHVPGVTVVVVRDGRVFYERGWGYADTASGARMDPHATKLRVASLTKIVTTIAVLQLCERGRLDVRDDVDSRLGDLKLPPTYAQPVTVGDLLTHSGGLDDGASGTAARDPRAAVPLATVLADHPATRFAPPGVAYSYTNRGMALAGEIVARVSGRPYPDYVRDEVLLPLGMRDSSFAPPAELGPAMAVGYRFDGRRYTAIPPDVVLLSPSAGLVSTGDDTARLAIALLHDRLPDQTTVLKPATLDTMLTRQFTNQPALPGATYGFRERDANGLAAVQQTGDWGGCASLLFLMPDQHLGLFVFSNSDDASLREEVVDLFLDRYYPQGRRIGSATPPDGFADRAACYTGTYRATRYAHDTFEKLYSFSSREEAVVTLRDDMLSLHHVGFVEIAPLLFRQIDGQEQIAFTGDDGRAAWLFVGTASYQRLAWYETYSFNRRLLIAVIAALCLTLVVWPGAILVTATRAASGGGPRAARLLAALVAVLDLGFLTGLGIAFQTVDFVYGVPRWFVALLALPCATAALSAALPVFCLLAWVRGYWTLPGRLQYTLSTLAALAFVWFCWYWNLLGFKL